MRLDFNFPIENPFEFIAIATADPESLKPTRPSNRLPAFPVIFPKTGGLMTDFLSWFPMASGMGELLELKYDGKVRSKLSARFGIATILTHYNQDIPKYDPNQSLFINYCDVKDLYGDHVEFSEERWDHSKVQERFMLAGDLYIKQHCSTPDYTLHTDISLAFARFIFMCTGRRPNEECCQLITTLCQTRDKFSFITDDMKYWEDVNALSESDKMAIFTELVNNKSQLSLVFQILLDRLNTYGWFTLHTVLDAIKKFPAIPWLDISQRWFSGQLEKFQEACIAFQKSKFAVLDKQLVIKHGFLRYKELVGFCSHLLTKAGVKRKIFFRTKLTEEQHIYIESILTHGINEPIPMDESLLRAINGIPGIEMSDGEISEFLARIKKEVEEYDEFLKEFNRKSLFEQNDIAVQDSLN
uniref:Uncharacterized protein LOC113797056 n=1 Tax=Dermatophagoides pteronyssinus TaxID=6956 RepID=A0A6P6YCV2_DERPT|nr:uncharacterized protein LOC113797056 [Dermatophagoides pteronyssinus]